MARRIGELAIVATAGWALITFALAVARRLWFPWPLEWMEGAVLEHAVRLLHGQRLYGPPSAEFVPLLYPPVSYAAIAATVGLFGATLPAARLASLLGTLATMGASGAAAARLCPDHRRWAALCAIGLVALGHGYGGTFYDLCRVDGVALALLAGGVALVGDGRRRGRAVVGMLTLVVATFAKQQAVAVLGALSLMALYRPAMRVGAAVGVATLVGLLVAGQAWTGGWLWTYCVSVPRGHALHAEVLPVSLLVDLLLPLPVVVIAWVIDVVRARRALDPAHVALFAGLAATLASRAHEGAFDNVLLTGYVLGVPVAAAAFTRGLCNPVTAFRRRGGIAALLLLQAAARTTPPASIAPGPRDGGAWRRARASLERCAAGAGAVALDHARLGDRPFAHTMAISDVLMGAPWSVRERTRRVVARGIDPRRLGAVGVGEATFPALDEALQDGFVPCQMVPPLPFVVGHDPGPMLVWQRRPEPDRPLASRESRVRR